MIRCLILDEVHMVTADTFRLATLHTHSNVVRYGLTATIRSDDHQHQIEQHIRGKVLFRADVKSLIQLGLLSPVNYNFIKCKPSFDPSWPTIRLRNKPFSGGLNPCVLATALKLVRFHQGAKIMVMSDFKQPIRIFKRLLGKTALYVDGNIPDGDLRKHIYRKFETTPNQVLLVTRVGDIALDIPCTNVLIQLSWQHGNVIQAVQRGGRLARQKHDMSSPAQNYILVNDEEAPLRFSKQAATYIAQSGFTVTWANSSVTNIDQCKQVLPVHIWNAIGNDVKLLQ
jgi:DNA excision repair protein ERCC-3